jgi:hypothetical protein
MFLVGQAVVTADRETEPRLGIVQAIEKPTKKRQSAHTFTVYVYDKKEDKVSTYYYNPSFLMPVFKNNHNVIYSPWKKDDITQKVEATRSEVHKYLRDLTMDQINGHSYIDLSTTSK